MEVEIVETTDAAEAANRAQVGDRARRRGGIGVKPALIRDKPRPIVQGGGATALVATRAGVSGRHREHTGCIESADSASRQGVSIHAR